MEESAPPRPPRVRKRASQPNLRGTFQVSKSSQLGQSETAESAQRERRRVRLEREDQKESVSLIAWSGGGGKRGRRHSAAALRGSAGSLSTGNLLNGERERQSLSENPEIPKIPRSLRMKKGDSKRPQNGDGAKAAKPRMRRGGGQWTTLCPFCSSETVAKLEIFGGIMPSEFESAVNESMAFTVMGPDGLSRSMPGDGDGGADGDAPKLWRKFGF